MEILDVTYIERKEKIIEGADYYEPVCDEKELDKMIQGDQEKLKNTKYLNGRDLFFFLIVNSNDLFLIIYFTRLEDIET